MPEADLTAAELPFGCTSVIRSRSINLQPLARKMATAFGCMVPRVECLRDLRCLTGDADSVSDDELWRRIRASARNVSPTVTLDNRLAYVVAALLYRKHEFDSAIKLVSAVFLDHFY